MTRVYTSDAAVADCKFIRQPLILAALGGDNTVPVPAALPHGPDEQTEAASKALLDPQTWEGNPQMTHIDTSSANIHSSAWPLLASSIPNLRFDFASV